jgi:hypothetical protein
MNERQFNPNEKNPAESGEAHQKPVTTPAQNRGLEEISSELRPLEAAEIEERLRYLGYIE